MPLAREQRKLAAIVAADVVGYSRLMGRDESGTLTRLRKNRSEHLDPVVTKYGGRLVKLTGDGALIEFASAVDALSAAIEFQQAVAEANGNMPADTALVFRMGLHLGDLIVDGDDLYGDGVNIAARLEAQAPAGGIVISRTVHEAVMGRLKATFDDLGSLSLKNIERAVQAFSVRWEPSEWQQAAMAEVVAEPRSATQAPLPLPDKPSIAVLPFDNMSGDPEQAYFADGLAEDLITGLSRVSWLFVIARNSSFAFRGDKLDVRAIGERLGVRYLVEGSVRRSGQRLRLTVQLIEAATGNHLWADRYDGALEDVFDFQDRTVASLIGAIEPKLRATEIDRARRKRPDNLDAFDLYLQALPKMGALSAQGLAEAIELLDRAIALSPGYAQALAYAAQCRSIRPSQGYSPDAARDLREAEQLSRRALESDPTDPIALRTVAVVTALAHRDYQTAWDLVDRSLAINPNDAMSWNIRGWISAWARETEMAMPEFEKAMRLSPLDPQWAGSVKHGIATNLCWGGRLEEALPWARKAVQELPNWSMTHRTLIATLWLSGRQSEAREAARRHVEMFPAFKVHQAREFSAFRRTDGWARYYDALYEAGLPE